MEKALKYKLVDDLRGSLAASDVFFVIYNRGMTVEQFRSLRRSLKGVGHIKVVKNRLVKIALSGSDHEAATDLMFGPTAIVYSNDPVSVAKAIVGFAKDADKLEIGGGVMSGVFLTAPDVRQLATLPSLDELRSQIVGLLQAPAVKLLGTLQAPAMQLARVVNAYLEEKK